MQLLKEFFQSFFICTFSDVTALPRMHFFPLGNSYFYDLNTLRFTQWKGWCSFGNEQMLVDKRVSSKMNFVLNKHSTSSIFTNSQITCVLREVVFKHDGTV